MSKYCEIVTTSNEKECIDKITKSLLEKRLVSYVQLSKRQSSYWWKNNIVNEEEYILTMGSKKELFDEIEKEIKLLHNYETPAIVMHDIEKANDEILKWIEDETINIEDLKRG
jgi:periplasmic divalent cation tolerance protein